MGLGRQGRLESLKVSVRPQSSPSMTMNKRDIANRQLKLPKGSDGRAGSPPAPEELKVVSVGTSRGRRDRYRKRLQTYLSYADDRDLLRLIWSANALQSGREASVGRSIGYSNAVATTDRNSKYFVHAWELETLVNELLATPKKTSRSEPPFTHLRCDEFTTVFTLANVLRALEDAEAGMTLKRMKPLTELHRISHRQFPWQRGFYNAPDLYRSSYLYTGEITSAYFEQTHGLTVQTFSLVGFALMTAFWTHAELGAGVDLSLVGLEKSEINAALKLLCAELTTVRKLARTLRSQSSSVAFSASALRRTPVISYGSANDVISSPLPDLLISRVTSGLYYDVAGGPASIRNEVAARFENYSVELLRRSFGREVVSQDSEYAYKGNRHRTTDIILSRKSLVKVAFECKARRMPVQAQFGERPVDQARSAFDEIAFGVIQLWRFFSHVRLGYVPHLRLADDVAGVVLTLDNWVSSVGILRGEIVDQAQIDSSKFPEIEKVDKRPVIFCSIEDLELTTRIACLDSFLDAVVNASKPYYDGWSLPNIHRDASESLTRPYVFDDEIGNVLPWWRRLEEERFGRQLPESEANVTGGHDWADA